MRRESRYSPLLNSFNIVEMTIDDLVEVLLIEQHSFPTPWSKNLFLKELHSEFSKILIATPNLVRGERVLGYIVLWFVSEEMHILNLASHPDYKRRGVATTLLEHSLFFSLKIGMKNSFLEVRESNQEALALYKKYGFKPIGIRKGYYSDTKEDAIVMMLEMESKSFFKDYFIGQR